MPGGVHHGQFVRTVSLEAVWLGSSLNHLLLNVKDKGRQSTFKICDV